MFVLFQVRTDTTPSYGTQLRPYHENWLDKMAVNTSTLLSFVWLISDWVEKSSIQFSEKRIHPLVIFIWWSFSKLKGWLGQARLNLLLFQKKISVCVHKILRYVQIKCGYDSINEVGRAEEKKHLPLYGVSIRNVFSTK